MKTIILLKTVAIMNEINYIIELSTNHALIFNMTETNLSSFI